MKKSILLLTVFAVLISMITLCYAGEIKVINEPGQEVNIEKFVDPNKTTIFDFFATWCGPCVRMTPMLENLAKNPNYVIYKVDIKDWGTPVCKQYNINSVPNFKIYEKGKLTYEGKEATQQILRLTK
jgi:thiol-disulfide isomerase/thioredoxin